MMMCNASRSRRSPETLPRRRRRRHRRPLLETRPMPLRPLSQRHRRQALGRRRPGKEERTGPLMHSTSARDWWDRFLIQVQESDRAAPLKEASLSENLSEWTRLTTEAVVRSCESLGWEAAARGHRLNRLPEPASEYLALDVMAFPSRDSSDVRWPLPVAVFELENSARDDRVGFSLWKVLCVRAPLRMVYA